MSKLSPGSLLSHAHSLSTLELRADLGEILNTVHYQNKTYMITRKNKPLAWLISDRIAGALDQLLRSDSGIAETFALLLDQQALSTIKKSRSESDEGKNIPIDKAFS